MENCLPASFDSLYSSGACRHLSGRRGTERSPPRLGKTRRFKAGRKAEAREPEKKKQSCETESDKKRPPLPARFRLIPPIFEMISEGFHIAFKRITSPSFSKTSFFLSTNLSTGFTGSAPASFKNWRISVSDSESGIIIFG